MTRDRQDDAEATSRALRIISVHRLPADDRGTRAEDDRVLVEQPVTIMVDQVGSYTIMCTPCDLEALAVGFILSEGLIDDMDDVVSVAASKADPNVIGVKLADTTDAAVERNLIVASSCGLCGARTIDRTLAETPPCGSSMTVSARLIDQVMAKLGDSQGAFRATGSAHAAGVFSAAGEFLSVAEDIGRHNALDKALGKCILAGQPIPGAGVALSGRVSFEMVAKAARAGIELIAAVSAPSSFAVDAAERWNMTLCGFVRPGRANVYTHPARIKELQDT